MDKTTFGKRLRALRDDAGLSLADLSKHVHYSTAQLSRVENGKSAPSAALAESCDRLFGTAPELARLARAAARPVKVIPSPAQFALPPTPAHFVGRDEELRRIATYLRTDDADLANVCVLHGMGGVGKTALAIHAANQVRVDFSGGCLFLDMHGYSPTVRPVGCEDALDRLLRRLGVPGELIPVDLDGRAGMLRHKLSERRVLVVLDDVEDYQQIQHLIPANRSAMIITSRRRLAALDDAMHIELRGLSVRSANALFKSIARLNEGGAAAGVDTQIDRIVTLCSRLPLMIRIAACRYRDNPGRTLADIERRLNDDHSRLRELDNGHRSATAVFATTLATARDEYRQRLALLALHPGAKIDGHSAAALAGTSVYEGEQLLDDLLQANLLEYDPAGMGRLPDLFRDYLRQLAKEILSPPERAAARHRLFDYYLRTAAAASELIDPYRYRIKPDLSSEPALGRRFDDYGSALEWMNSEQENLLSLASEMSRRGFDGPCWQFCYHLRGFFFVTKLWTTWIEAFRIAVQAARRVPDRRAEGIMLNDLGVALAEFGKHGEAELCYTNAERAFREIDDPQGAANANANRAWSHYYLGEFRRARQLSEDSTRFYSMTGQRPHAAIALDCLARTELELGEPRKAYDNFRRVLTEYTELGFPPVDTAQVLTYLGRCCRRLGNLLPAREHFVAAIEQSRAGGSRHQEATALEGLSEVARQLGEFEEATKFRSSALALYETLGAPEAERLRSTGSARGTTGDIVAPRPPPEGMPREDPRPRQ